MKQIKIVLIPLFLLLYILILYKPYLVNGKLPIPADAIVGMYHPWRDALSQEYPRGVPVKNSLITDAVRQEYPWRQLAVEQLKRGQYPAWNPYSFSGYPLSANFQSAPFYPLNILYWLGEFSKVWSWQVIFQTVLGMTFMAAYLRHLKLRGEAVALGSLAWAGSGFFVSWLETNTVVQTAVWLPLIFLAVDQILSKNKLLVWGLVLTGSLVSTLLAGHLQTAVYSGIAMGLYTAYRALEKKTGRGALLVLTFNLLAGILLMWWLRPGWQFIGLSARNVDQAVWQKPDWFIPWQNAVQFIAPDFFGNPATQNYFGVWNYGEFVGYVGIIPLIFALIAAFSFKRDSRFFAGLMVISTLLAFPTFLAKIPFQQNWPLVASAQPSRLLVLIDFSLAILAAIGLEQILVKASLSRVVKIVTLLLMIVTAGLVLYTKVINLNISLRNLYLPLVLIAASGLMIWLLALKRFQTLIVLAVLALTLFDLSRFATKFETFSPKEWLYPRTATIEFLQKEAETDNFRIAPIDERITAPNFLTAYNLQAISGYDPLYLERYAQFIAAVERNRPDISAPGFNRIVTPKNYQSPFFDLLGVKYVLTFDDIGSARYKLVFQEGLTRVYENKTVLPRAFFADGVVSAADRQQAIGIMFNRSFDVHRMAVAEANLGDRMFSAGKVTIRGYLSDEIIIETENKDTGYLVLADVYYPAWRATIDSNPAEIIPTDYAFRGLVVPAGKHIIRFWL